MRSMFKGVLGFGLVSIPVELYRAVGAERVESHWIHRGCGERVRYQKLCPACDRVLDSSDIARAAVLDDGRLVPLDDEEAPAERRPLDRAISILSFHPLADLDPVYFDQAYWLKAASGGQKAYRLLSQAMALRQQVAVARMAARERPRLSVVRPYGTGALMLHSMHWPEAVRLKGAHFGSGGPEASDREQEMALALVDHLSEPFTPAAYPDEARAALMAALAERADQGHAVAPAGPPPGLTDLVDQLRRSLEDAPAVPRAAVR